MALGPEIRFRGEAANIVAGGLAVAAICAGVGVTLLGVAAIVAASGTAAALAARAKPPVALDAGDRRDALAVLRPSAPSLPKP